MEKLQCHLQRVYCMKCSLNSMYGSYPHFIKSSDPSLLLPTPIAFSSASSASSASLISFDSIPAVAPVVLAADVAASVVTTANHPTLCVKDMENCPELMVVMNRLQSNLESSCKRVGVLLQDAIRQREECILSNEVDLRNFNESISMTELKEFEKKEKATLSGLEQWYEEEVGKIESGYSQQLEECEKELEDYRSGCFQKAEMKEKELEKELKNDPPERVSRIRSQVLERFHNKLVEGENAIQAKASAVKERIQHDVNEIEREYQKRRRGIVKEYTHLTHSIKRELLERKENVKAMCDKRRKKARDTHATALNSSKEIIEEVLQQTKDVESQIELTSQLLRSFEEAYANSFPITTIYFSNDIMRETALMIIKKVHLFCDIRVHEQTKKMNAIQSEMDGFLQVCNECIEKQKQLQVNSNDNDEQSWRADVFVKSTMKLQSQMIGRVLLEMNDNDCGFHSKVTMIREQCITTFGNQKGNTEIMEATKKKNYSILTEYAKNELELEYKRCVQDIMHFSIHSATLFYKEMAIRYWLLFMFYKSHPDKDNELFEELSSMNQDILNHLNTSQQKGILANALQRYKENAGVNPTDPLDPNKEVEDKNSITQGSVRSS